MDYVLPLYVLMLWVMRKPTGLPMLSVPRVGAIQAAEVSRDIRSRNFAMY